MDESVVLLWGDMGAGKTSLLAAALLEPHAEASLDPVVNWPASIPAVRTGLQPHWRQLCDGVPLNPTVSPASVPVVLRSGRRVVFRDVMGEETRTPEKQAMDEELTRAAAVLFVLSWGSPERRRQLEAVRAALPSIGNKPRAVAFTKCETGLPHGHPDWDTTGGPRAGWWDRAADWLPAEAHTLGRAGDVWPTSVYGFHDGRPACLLDEFGETIPFQIKPVNATEVVAWFLHELNR